MSLRSAENRWHNGKRKAKNCTRFRRFDKRDKQLSAPDQTTRTAAIGVLRNPFADDSCKIMRGKIMGAFMILPLMILQKIAKASVEASLRSVPINADSDSPLTPKSLSCMLSFAGRSAEGNTD